MLCVVGCNEVYDLDPTVLTTFDRDEDGVQDAVDNCPDVPNADQSDEDHDVVGDRCDNCPLVANATQQALADADGVGDACDPRPDVDGDCLIVVDTFRDPTAFAAHWSVLAEPGDTPDVRPEVDSVAITSHADFAVAIVARDDNGNVMTGVHDVQLLARSKPVVLYAAVVAAVSNASRPRGGYACSLFGNVDEVVHVTNDGIMVQNASMSSEPVLDRLLLRLVIDGNELGCRIEHGIAVGGLRVSVVPTPISGGPGASVRKIDLQIDAFAAYEARPGQVCPEVRWR
jgi:hypothetical protein